MMHKWRSRTRRGKPECPPGFALVKEPADHWPWHFVHGSRYGIKAFHTYGFRTRREAATAAWKFWTARIVKGSAEHG
jgi:hypothetical protein